MDRVISRDSSWGPRCVISKWMWTVFQKSFYDFEMDEDDLIRTWERRRSGAGTGKHIRVLSG